MSSTDADIDPEFVVRVIDNTVRRDLAVSEIHGLNALAMPAWVFRVRDGIAWANTEAVSSGLRTNQNQQQQQQQQRPPGCPSCPEDGPEGGQGYPEEDGPGGGGGPGGPGGRSNRSSRESARSWRSNSSSLDDAGSSASSSLRLYGRVEDMDCTVHIVGPRRILLAGQITVESSTADDIVTLVVSPIAYNNEPASLFQQVGTPKVLISDVVTDFMDTPMDVIMRMLNMLSNGLPVPPVHAKLIKDIMTDGSDAYQPILFAKTFKAELNRNSRLHALKQYMLRGGRLPAHMCPQRGPSLLRIAAERRLSAVAATPAALAAAEARARLMTPGGHQVRQVRGDDPDRPVRRSQSLEPAPPDAVDTVIVYKTATNSVVLHPPPSPPESRSSDGGGEDNGSSSRADATDAGSSSRAAKSSHSQSQDTKRRTSWSHAFVKKMIDAITGSDKDKVVPPLPPHPPPPASFASATSTSTSSASSKSGFWSRQQQAQVGQDRRATGSTSANSGAAAAASPATVCIHTPIRTPMARASPARASPARTPPARTSPARSRSAWTPPARTPAPTPEPLPEPCVEALDVPPPSAHAFLDGAFGPDAWEFDALACHDPDLMPLMCLKLCREEGVLATLPGIDERRLWAFLWTVNQGYSDSCNYHNARHAASVLHNVHMVLVHGGVLERIATTPHSRATCLLVAYVAACIHDYEHRGVTNAFLIETTDPLAILYNDVSPQENHHSASAFRLMLRCGLNFAEGLDRSTMRSFRGMIVRMILGTDMNLHFPMVTKFKVRAQAQPAWHANQDDVLLVLQMMLKIADLSHLTYGFDLHRRWTERITEEFFVQGDREACLGLAVSPLCDRTRGNMGACQVDFIKFVARDLFAQFADEFGGCAGMHARVNRNYAAWAGAAASASASEVRTDPPEFSTPLETTPAGTPRASMDEPPAS